MRNLYSVESSNGVRVDIQTVGRQDLNCLLLAKDLCFQAIKAIDELIDKNYPIQKNRFDR